jgi:spermidine synthase
MKNSGCRLYQNFEGWSIFLYPRVCHLLFEGYAGIIEAMTDKELFYSEAFTHDYVRKFKVENIFFEGRTKYQYVQCFSNALFGKVLFLDKKIQSAQVDEYVYHESLVHPAMMTHLKPQRVLVLGGGEGATLREVYRHSTIESITMVDIDEELVGICKKHLSEWPEGAYEDKRTRLVIGDARQFVEETVEKFDVVISDLTEPLEEGPSVYLFTKEFYQEIDKVLDDDGVFVLQAGSTDPTYHEFFASCAKTLNHVFPIVRPYWTFVFSFGCPWGFVAASKREDPLDLAENDLKKRADSRRIKGLKFYHEGLHKGFFALPGYLVKGLEKGRVLTDREPFIWEQ